MRAGPEEANAATNVPDEGAFAYIRSASTQSNSDHASGAIKRGMRFPFISDAPLFIRSSALPARAPHHPGGGSDQAKPRDLASSFEAA